MKGLVYLVSFSLVILSIAFAVQLKRLENRVGDLETKNVYLNMRIGTNKLLLKETQRMVVPDERALKREVLKW
jgi:hypothetical protein